MLDGAVLVTHLLLQVEHVLGQRVGLPEHHVEQRVRAMSLAVLEKGHLGRDGWAKTPGAAVGRLDRLLLALGRARHLGAGAVLPLVTIADAFRTPVRSGVGLFVAAWPADEQRAVGGAAVTLQAAVIAYLCPAILVCTLRYRAVRGRLGRLPVISRDESWRSSQAEEKNRAQGASFDGSHGGRGGS